MIGNHEEIDVLIEKIKQEIAEEGLLYEEKVSFKEPEEGANDNRGIDPELHYFFPLTSSKKGIGAVVVFIKRVIRKSVRFLLLPITTEQSEINKSLLREIDRLNRMIEGQERKIEQLEEGLKANEG